MDAILVSEPKPPFAVRVATNVGGVFVTVGKSNSPESPLRILSGQTVVLTQAQALELSVILSQASEEELPE